MTLHLAGRDDLDWHNTDPDRSSSSTSHSISCSHGCRATAAAFAQRRYPQDGSGQVHLPNLRLCMPDAPLLFLEAAVLMHPPNQALQSKQHQWDTPLRQCQPDACSFAMCRRIGSDEEQQLLRTAKNDLNITTKGLQGAHLHALTARERPSRNEFNRPMHCLVTCMICVPHCCAKDQVAAGYCCSGRHLNIATGSVCCTAHASMQ